MSGTRSPITNKMKLPPIKMKLAYLEYARGAVFLLRSEIISMLWSISDSFEKVLVTIKSGSTHERTPDPSINLIQFHVSSKCGSAKCGMCQQDVYVHSVVCVVWV